MANKPDRNASRPSIRKAQERSESGAARPSQGHADSTPKNYANHASKAPSHTILSEAQKHAQAAERFFASEAQTEINVPIRPNLKTPLTIAGIAAAVILIVVVALAVRSCAPEPLEPAATSDAEGRVSFVAVGDNLPDAQIGYYAAECAANQDGVDYEYKPIYQYVKPYIEAPNVAYMKEETHLGGNELEPSGYPSFNITDEMADAVVDMGVDMVASASNHSYDWGAFGALDHSAKLWAEKPVAFTGTAADQGQADRLALVEKNGITIALLDYTYGVNGYTQADLPAYAVNFIGKDRIARDVEKAKQAADVVIVAMHWGTENLTEADERQQLWADYLTSLDVDLVLGSHPHVIGPLEWKESASGHKTLVAYSLGNFLSNHEAPTAYNQIEGMLNCNFVRQEDESVTIEDVQWTTLVNHNVPGEYAIYALQDYTKELAEKNPALSQVDDPINWIAGESKAIVGEGFTVDAALNGSSGDSANEEKSQSA